MVMRAVAGGAGAGGALSGSSLSIAQGTLTANATGVSITATWNNAAVTFDAPLFMNITNIASNANSLIMDLQVGGVSAFNVSKGGTVIANSFVVSADSSVLAVGQLRLNADSGISRLGAASLAVGNGTAGDFSGALKLTTLNIASGGSTTISTGVGSVKMSTANAATNAAWIPLQYAGTTYFVAGFTTNAP